MPEKEDKPHTIISKDEIVIRDDRKWGVVKMPKQANYEVVINTGQQSRQFISLSQAMKFYGDSIIRNEVDVIDFYEREKLVSRWTLHTGFIEY